MQHFNENNATWLEETYQAGTTYQETPETWKPDLVLEPGNPPGWKVVLVSALQMYTFSVNQPNILTLLTHIHI